ncbi:hypothetical protein XU18_3104 [Perkinsela sp. CCAP 1560/4]|nr:hypothetical protein XU18_3104 [Perkinsela sp. CCAP 1560/4]|eukprot:KNH05942.1 hypothetical protein XU18_3104 [Perkinsela sp. CCAP 1560/4]
MTKDQKNQHRAGASSDAAEESLDEEFVIMHRMYEQYTANEHIFDALTRASAPNEFVALLFVNKKAPSVRLALAWSVSDEIQILSSEIAFFLCDVDDIELIEQTVNYLHNVPDFSEGFARHCTNGIPEAPSLIVLKPATRTLFYAEYSCELTSLCTLLMLLQDYHTEQPSRYGLSMRPRNDTLSDETHEESIDESDSDYFSDTADEARMLRRQQHELSSLQRVQERHDIHSEYMQALAADQQAETAAHEESLREKAEHEKQISEKLRLAEIANVKTNIRAKMTAVEQTSDSVRICLRTRTGEKVLFNVPPAESVQVVLEMAFATDPDAAVPSDVSIRSVSPSTVYRVAMDSAPTVGEVASGSTTFTFITECEGKT